MTMMMMRYDKVHCKNVSHSCVCTVCYCC